MNFNSVKHLCFLKEHDFAIKFILYLVSNMNLSSDLKFINSSKEHLFCNLNDHKIFLKKELIEIAYNYAYYEPLYKLSEFLIINH